MQSEARVKSPTPVVVCPYGCPACAEEARERQARRDLIMLAQDELFDDGASPAREGRPLERVSFAA